MKFLLASMVALLLIPPALVLAGSDREPARAIRGVVVDGADAPLERVEIMAAHQQRSGDSWRQQVKSSADGSFEIHPPSGGSYDLTFRVTGFRNETRTVTLTPSRRIVDLGTIECGQPGVICDDVGLK